MYRSGGVRDRAHGTTGTGVKKYVSAAQAERIVEVHALLKGFFPVVAGDLVDQLLSTASAVSCQVLSRFGTMYDSGRSGSGTPRLFAAISWSRCSSRTAWILGVK